MKTSNLKSRMSIQLGAAVMLCTLAAAGAWAQDTSSTTIKHGPASYDTQVKNAEVVYVEGNDLVLRVDNGRLEHLVVPDSDRFLIDGKEVGVNELTPGTKLTQTITTTTTPRYVTTVRNIKGKVWHVNAPRNVIVTLPGGNNQIFDLPSHAKFTIHGEPKTVFDLRKGMDLEATVITDSEETVMSQSKSVVGQAPVAAPREIGLLLVLQPWHVPPAPQMAEASQQAAPELPETASLFPLMGLLGSAAVALSLGLTTVRRAVAVR